MPTYTDFTADGFPTASIIELGPIQDPDIAVHADGSYVVVFRAESEIYAWFYNAFGEPQGGTQVNTVTSNSQQKPVVKTLEDGGFIVTWETFHEGHGDYNFAGRIYDASGNPTGGQFDIQASGNYGDIVELDDGSFLFLFRSNTLQATHIAADGTHIDTFEVSAAYSSVGSNSISATRLADGSIAVAWDNIADNDGYGTYVNIISPDLTPSPNDILVASDETGWAWQPKITGLEDGGFVVVWERQDTSDIWLRVFDSSGTAVSADIQIDGLSPSFQYSPDVTALYDGGFVVSWRGSEVYGSIYAQRFDETGTATSDVTRIDISEDNVWPHDPVIASSGDGTFVVAWEINPDGAIYSRIYNYNTSLTGTAEADTLTAGRFDDALTGGAGDDTLEGGAGNDVLDGGDGLDLASYAGASTAVVVNLASPGSNTGDAAGDSYTGIEGILGSAHNDALYGDTSADWLDGNAGNDTLRGGLGSDNLDGGAGHDRVDYRDSSVGVSIDLSSGVNTGGTAAGDTLTNIEEIVGSNYNDTLTAASDGGMIVFAVNGNDHIMGGSGIDRFYGGDGNDTLQGGLGADQLFGEGGYDRVDYRDSASGVSINLSTGVFSGGSAEGDSLTSIEEIVGSSHGDTVVAAEGGTTFFGVGGDDSMTGGAGLDRFYGGAGTDTIDYSASNSAVLVNLGTGRGQFGDAAGDQIVEVEAVIGSSHNDTLIGSSAGDSLDGGAGHDRVDYRSSTAGVSLNLSTGLNTGGTAAGDTLTNIEEIVGSNLGDTLVAADSGTIFFGVNGDDRMTGGAGLDRFYGGAGTDTIDYSGSDSAVFINLGTGRGQFGDAEGDQFADVEAAVGSSHNDTLIGSSAGDSLDGGDGHDRVDYRSSTAGISINLSTGVNTGGTAAGDTLTNIEEIVGSNLNDTLTAASDGGMIVFAVNGNDHIMGGSGIDRFYGGNGNDTLQGGLGADQLFGEGGYDRVDYRDSASGVSINLSTGVFSGGSAEGDSLTSIEEIVGSSHGDTVVAAEGGTTFFGVGGDDSMTGGAGLDRFYGGAGTDTIDYSASSSAVLVNLGTGRGQFGDADGDQIVEVEAVIGSSHNDTLIGSSAGDSLDGGDGHDRVDYRSSTAGVSLNLSTGVNTGGTAAGDTLTNIEEIVGSNLNDTLTAASDEGMIVFAVNGNDHIMGGNGIDRFYGGNGNDTLQGGLGADQLFGEGGYDRVDYRDSASGVSINLQTSVFTGGSAEGDSLTSIEEVVASSHNDTLVAADSGSTFFAVDGNDSLTGGIGVDRFYGGNGNDTLDGGAGNDLLSGGEGADAFLFHSGWGTDLITDFESGIDHISFYNTGLSFSDLTIAQDGDDVVISVLAGDSIRLSGASVSDIDESDFTFAYTTSSEGTPVPPLSGGENVSYGTTGDDELLSTDAVDVFFGDAGSDSLAGGTGNDSLYGESGDDVIDGGEDDDLLDGGSGHDLLIGGDGNDSIIGGAGIDTITGSLGDDTVQGGDDSDEIYGAGGNDSLDGGDGDDFLDGGTGDDTIVASAGIDTVNGGEGFDVLDFLSQMSRGVGAEIDGSATSGGEIITSIVGIEALRGTNFSDTLGGAANNDLLEGNGGDDLLFGWDGDDTLLGGNGNDSIVGGDGSDSIEGGAGNDTIEASLGGDTINGGTGFDVLVLLNNLSTGYTVDMDGMVSSSGDPIASISEIEGISGSSYNDTLIGAGSDELLEGSAGDDIITGGAGADTLSGQSGDDQINGGADNDLLDGGDGNDLIEGGDGDDTINGLLGHDTIDGGAGFDILDLMGMISSGVDADLDGLVSAEGEPIGSLSNIEGIRGSNFDDTLTGAANNDLLEGNGGSDSLTGNAGDDTLRGGDGDDTIDGGDGNDSLSGGEGADTLDGGSGDDSLAGGSDADTFTFASAHGNDVITDFNVDEDVLDLTGTGIVNFKDIDAEETSFGGIEGVLLPTGDGHTIFVQGVTVGEIAAAVRLVGGDTGDNDTFTATDGADNFVFTDNHGNDVITGFNQDEDTLDLTAITGLTSYADLDPDGTSVDGVDGVLINTGGSNTIFIAGVNVGELAGATIVN